MSIGTLIVTLVTWVVFLIFPAWAAYRLFKRGQSKHGWATLLTIPVGLGWLVGIYGLTRPAGEPVRLDEPCPACEGTEGARAEVRLDARSGERTPPLIGAIAAVVVGLAIIGGLAALAITTWIEGDDGFIQWQYGSKIAGAGFLLIGLSFGTPVIRYGLAYFAADRVTGTFNRCVACGNKWTSLPGEGIAGTAAVPDGSAYTCRDGPEGCWGPVFGDEAGLPLCRGHLARREHEAPAPQPPPQTIDQTP